MRIWPVIIIMLWLLAILSPVRAYAQADGERLSVPPANGAPTLQPQEQVDRKNFANAYFERCTAEDDPSLEGTAQEDTCICHTVHMQEYLETEELRSLGTGQGNVPIRKDALFVNVYAPCLEFAIRDMEERKCYGSARIRAMARTQQMYEGMCACVASGAASFVREYGRVHMAALLERNPVFNDPIGGVLRSYEYRDEISRLYKKCINGFTQ